MSDAGSVSAPRYRRVMWGGGVEELDRFGIRRNVLDSLNPVYIWRVISRIGADYFIVIGIWFAATVAAAAMSSPVISPFARIPIAGGMIASVLSFWALFYVAHLLGYAIYRHSRELGWE